MFDSSYCPRRSIITISQVLLICLNQSDSITNYTQCVESRSFKLNSSFHSIRSIRIRIGNDWSTELVDLIGGSPQLTLTYAGRIQRILIDSSFWNKFIGSADILNLRCKGLIELIELIVSIQTIRFGLVRRRDSTRYSCLSFSARFRSNKL